MLVRRWRLVTALLCGLLVVPAGIAVAAPMQPVNDTWDPWDKVRAIYPDDLYSGTGRPYVGTSFQDSNVFNGSVLQAMLPVPGAPGVSSGWACTGPDAAPCDTAERLHVSGALPACSELRQVNCVEGLYLRSGGQATDGRSLGEWIDDADTRFDEIAVTNGQPVPASGRPSLWDLPEAPHAAGSLYLVSASVTSELDRGARGWSRRTSELSVQVLAVERSTFSGVELCPNALTSWATQQCLIKHRLPDQSLGVRLRVSPDFGAFIFGRVVDPVVDIQDRGEGIVLSVEGRPAATPQAAIAVPVSEAPDFVQPWEIPDSGARLNYMNAGQVGSLSLWRGWSPYLGNRSDAVKRIWGFRSADGSFAGASNCVAKGVVAGWVSTNAMVFEATPPVFDRVAGTMDFKVGGPHLTPQGGIATAEYDFLLRESVADCIWPGKDLTAVATVSVINAGESDEVASTSVGVSEGWVKFTARNFSFPALTTRANLPAGTTPTIRVTVKSKEKAPVFRTCAALWKVHKDGVAATGAINTVTVKGKKITRPALGKPFVSDEIYNANVKLDKDGDRLVCEREPRVR